MTTKSAPATDGDEMKARDSPRAEGSRREASGFEVSVVIPCLDESDTLAACIRVAREAMQSAGIEGEIVVADNGSTDGSVEIALAEGARVVHVATRGYGAALLEGIAEAHGEVVIMGDADLSYDFAEIPRFVERLREGYDLVQGCRLPAGRGTVMPGAMPFLHRWIGNPILSALARLLFRSPVTDIYCGLRGFRREWQMELGQECVGMEFASEMIVKASISQARITEIPVTLHPDGRVSHPPHLRTFRDGWRTLRFFLLFSPRWLFVYPGIALILFGILGYAIALPGLRVGGVQFDVSTLLFATLGALVGHQALILAASAQAYGLREGLLPRNGPVMALLRPRRLETGLVAGLILGLIGVVLLGLAVLQWWSAGFGDLEYPRILRLVIPGMLFTGLGVQTIFGAFHLSLLDTHRR